MTDQKYIGFLESRNACLHTTVVRLLAVMEKSGAGDIHWIKTGERIQETAAQGTSEATAERFIKCFGEMSEVTDAAKAFLTTGTPETKSALQKKLAIYERGENRRTRNIQALAKKGEPWWDAKP